MSIDRATLAGVLADHRNGWMHSFSLASSGICHAVVDGKVTEADLTSGDGPRIARAAGLPWKDTHGNVYKDGWNQSIDDEDVEVTVGALRGILNADVDDDSATWAFPYPELLEARGATLEDVKDAMRQVKTLTDAARLIVEADSTPIL